MKEAKLRKRKSSITKKTRSSKYWAKSIKTYGWKEYE